MKKTLSSDENHFIVLKYNHYHDRERGKHNDVIGLFIDIIDTINFKEENSLFWIFADHGEPGGVDIMMKPPMSWLSWASVTDNITNKKVTKDRIYMLDYYNTIMNTIYSNNEWVKYRERSEDIFSEVDVDRVYVAEDGRSKVDEWNCTTVSAIKYLDENRFVQVVKHIGTDLHAILYDRRHISGDDTTWLCSSINIQEIKWWDEEHSTIEKLTNYLMSNVWRRYFE